MTRLTLKFARDWQREAVGVADLDRRARIFAAAVRLERRDALHSLLALARDLTPIADDGTRWDADPWLLGVANGIVELRTGILRPGRREDRFTMSAAVPFDDQAACPRWLSFLEEVFDADQAVISFVQRALGYSLSGDTSEQCLFVCYGAGANGKSTLLSTISEITGDYAYVMPFSTVELRDRAAIPNDLAALVGRRLVTASETQDGTRLNEARLKALTGCDPMTARFLHREFFTFKPVAKIWLSVNHKPLVRDDSYGFWRRVRLIPFTQTFALNGALAGELRAESLGILAWAVRGCLAWQREGLRPPPSVLLSTAEYEHDSDELAAFLDEACERDTAGRVGASDLYGHYKGWADRVGLTDSERLTSTKFGRKMGERFKSEKDRRSGVKYYRGVVRAGVKL